VKNCRPSTNDWYVNVRSTISSYVMPIMKFRSEPPMPVPPGQCSMNCELLDDREVVHAAPPGQRRHQGLALDHPPVETHHRALERIRDRHVLRLA
jgi:hypothetical protein